MFDNVKDMLPDVKCDTPPTPPQSPPRPILKIKEKKKNIKNKDIFLYSHNNKMESNDNVKIVSAEVIEKEAKAAAEPVAEPAAPSSPKRRLGDRGKDKKVRKKRWPNGMPPEKLAQLALARKKALEVRKARAQQRKAEKKREQNARYNHPAPEPKPVSKPIPIPQPKPKPRISREEAESNFFGLMDRWDLRRQSRKKKRREQEEAERQKRTPKPVKAPTIHRHNNGMDWDSLFF